MIILFYGVVLVVFGVGLLLVKVDGESFRRDEKRVGPLSLFNLGMGYVLFGHPGVRKAVSLVCIAAGILLIALSHDGL